MYYTHRGGPTVPSNPPQIEQEIGKKSETETVILPTSKTPENGQKLEGILG